MISQSEDRFHSIDWLSQSGDSIDLVVGHNVDGALGAVVGQLGHAHGLVHHTLEHQRLVFEYTREGQPCVSPVQQMRRHRGGSYPWPSYPRYLLCRTAQLAPAANHSSAWKHINQSQLSMETWPIIAQCDIISTNEKPHLALHQRVDSLQMAGVGHHGQANVPDGDQSEVSIVVSSPPITAHLLVTLLSRST